MAESRRRRRRTLVWIAVALAAAIALAVGGTLTWSGLDAQRRLDEARELSSAEQAIIDDALADASRLATQTDTQRAAYRDAAAIWDESRAAVERWRTEVVAPTVAVPNPGGDELPGGNEPARALLDSIGASEVQLVFDAGEQNCGFRPAEPGSLSLGGCYNSRFRTSLFMAWDPGVGREDIWPAFVHEAMHWYQWEHYFTMFLAAERLGITQDAYLAPLESDASCRAVVVHGVPRGAYDSSSAPCDVADWHGNWFVEQLAALGVPVGPPDPELFEVTAVVRP